MQRNCTLRIVQNLFIYQVYSQQLKNVSMKKSLNEIKESSSNNSIVKEQLNLFTGGASIEFVYECMREDFA